MAKLALDFLGIRFPNPFLLGSGPPTEGAAMIRDAFRAGWGGAILKTVGLAPTPEPCPRVHIIRHGRNIRGMVNIELITQRTLEQWGHDLDDIRDAYPDRPIIASIMGGAAEEEWAEVVRPMQFQKDIGIEIHENQ